jgi:hypothetical protein
VIETSGGEVTSGNLPNVAESFMKTLNREEINESSYRNLSQARSAIGAFIETIYNRPTSTKHQRLHSALAYR